MPRSRLLLAVLLACISVAGSLAQPARLRQPKVGGGLDPTALGATGDGVARLVSAPVAQGGLGITALHDLLAYTARDGSRPYERLGSAPVGNYRALPILALAASGAVRLDEHLTFTVGAPTSTPFIPIATRGWGDVRPNMRCSGEKLPRADVTIAALNPHDSVLQLSAVPTQPLAAGDTFTCGFDLSKITEGMAVTAGKGRVARGTTVARIDNTWGSESITLSNPLSGELRNGEYLEYSAAWSDQQVATSLTMDLLGLQAALTNMAASGGGRLTIPPGTYMMGDLTLTLPSAARQNPAQGGVDLVGSGQQNTLLQWTADPGFGGFFLSGEFPLSNNAGSPGILSDLAINGPGRDAAPGTSLVNAMAIGWGNHRRIERVGISHAFACLAISGDQTTFSNVDGHACYYGVYFHAENSFQDFGDQRFENVSMSNMHMAGIACGSLANCGNGLTYVRSILANCPFGFFKETNSSNVNTLFNGLLLDDVQIEGTGIAAFSDDQPARAPKAILGNLSLRETEFTWDRAGWVALPVAPGIKSTRGSFMQGQRVTGEMLVPRELHGLTPGTSGIFNVATGGMQVHADWNAVIDNAAKASAPFVNAIWMTPQGDAWQIEDLSGWSGRPCNACGHPERGTVLALQANGGRPGPSQGNATEYPLGVAMFDGGATEVGVIATSGQVQVRLGGATTAIHVPLRTGPGGTVLQAAGRQDPASPVIGYATQDERPAGAPVMMALRPL